MKYQGSQTKYLLWFDSHSKCDEKFAIPQNLVNFHHKFSCSVCHEKFKQFSRIQFHLKSCFVQETQHNCSYCGTEMNFKNILDLFQHLAKNHSGQVEKPFQCQFCQSAFKLRTSYQKVSELLWYYNLHLPCEWSILGQL